jgi:7-carboxy-7-deazaguanine synthase
VVNIIHVAEVFGPTIQGEGPHAGRASAFLRLGGCNLSCSWCDSAYTWDGSRYDLREEITSHPVPELLARMPSAPVCVVTGGEPLLHQRNPGWHALLDALRDRYDELHLETNGTIEPTMATQSAFHHITVSPKLDNAGIHRGQQDPHIWPEWFTIWQSVFKYVVRDAEDVGAAVQHARVFKMPRERIWVMPEGVRPDVLLQRWPAIVDAAALNGINATQRLHILAWGDHRGH